MGASTAIVRQFLHVRLADLEKHAVAGEGELDFAAVFEGEPSQSPVQAIEILAGRGAAFDAYEVPVTPFGVVVGPDGIVWHTRHVGSEGAVQELVDAAKVNHDATA